MHPAHPKLNLPQHPTFGPSNLGADILGAFILRSGLMTGPFNFGLQHELHPIHPMHDMAPQHPTFGPSSLGADILGALSLGGLIDGAFNLGLQHDIPEQHPTFGVLSLGADILGVLSFGAANFGLQHLLAPQQAHEAIQFYQHPTFLASFGPSIFGAILFSGLIAISSFLAPFGSTGAALPIIMF
jgi:hypothetical protein